MLPHASPLTKARFKSDESSFMNTTINACLCLLFGLVATVAQSQDKSPDPFAEFENVFRSVPENETTEQRALALLDSQKWTISSLEMMLQAHKQELQRSVEQQKQTTTILTRLLIHQFNQDATNQQIAIQQVDELLELLADRDLVRQTPTWLEGPLEEELEKAFSSATLHELTVNLFEKHLTSQGIMLGHQPSGGYWRPIGEVTSVETGNTRSRLAESEEYYFDQYSLIMVLEELSSMTGIDFNFDLSTEQQDKELTYIRNNVEIADALDEILLKNQLGYMVKGNSIQIYPQGDSRLQTRDIFFVHRLLSKEVNLEKLIELAQSGIDENKKAAITVIDKNSFAAIGTEPQLRNISKFLGSFRPSKNSGATTDSEEDRTLHPAAEFANRVVKAIQNKDVPALASMAKGQSEEQLDGLGEFVEEIQAWFRGVNEVMELRERRGAIVAKVRKIGGEVIVVTMNREGDGYALEDINSPSEDDYEELKVIPLYGDKN